MFCFYYFIIRRAKIRISRRPTKRKARKHRKNCGGAGVLQNAILETRVEQRPPFQRALLPLPKKYRTLSKKYVVPQTWHDSRTIVARYCHGCENIDSQLWYNIILKGRVIIPKGSGVNLKEAPRLLGGRGRGACCDVVETAQGPPRGGRLGNGGCVAALCLAPRAHGAAAIRPCRAPSRRGCCCR